MLTAYRVAAAVLLSSLLFCAAPRAYVAQGEAPAEFSLRSLDGGRVTSSDLRNMRPRLARLTDGRRMITP
jgi:hypothetical protein